MSAMRSLVSGRRDPAPVGRHDGTPRIAGFRRIVIAAVAGEVGQSSLACDAIGGSGTSSSVVCTAGGLPSMIWTEYWPESIVTKIISSTAKTIEPTSIEGVERSIPAEVHEVQADQRGLESGDREGDRDVELSGVERVHRDGDHGQHDEGDGGAEERAVADHVAEAVFVVVVMGGGVVGHGSARFRGQAFGRASSVTVTIGRRGQWIR